MLLSLCVWGVLWQIAAYRVGISFLLPSPGETLSALWELKGDGVLWRSAAYSMLRILCGFGIGALAGAVFALGSFLLSGVEAFLSPVLYIVRATPVASFILLVILWIRADQVPIFISLLMVFPIVYASVLSALKQTDRALVEMADSFGFSFWKKLGWLYLPSALPSLATSSLTSLGLAWKAGIAAEILCATSDSIGNQMRLAKLYLQTEQLLAWTVVVVVMSVLLEAVLRLISHAVAAKLSGRFATAKEVDRHG